MTLDPVDVSLSQLRCFLAIVDAGSFAEAGRRLGLSPSVVSKTMARLEAAHGVKLLHRSTHSVSPTEEGRALIEPARAAGAALQDVVEVLDHSGAGAGGTVRLTAPIAFLRHCLIPMLPELRRALPHTRLDLRASNEFLDLASHGIDVAIRSGSLDDVPGHVRQVWFSCPWVVCATPAYLAGRAVPTMPLHLEVHELIGFRASEDGLVRA
jgi:DNA-binding transcriptional LysR family regulator